jgi:hypothetical protein
MIDVLQPFCSSHGLLVNVGKTKIMQKGKPASFTWTYRGTPVEEVGEYRNLGITVHAKGHFAQQCADVLAKSGSRAMHALLSRCAELHINSPHLMLQLFDTMVKPVFLYDYEVWAVEP